MIRLFFQFGFGAAVTSGFPGLSYVQQKRRSTHIGGIGGIGGGRQSLSSTTSSSSPLVLDINSNHHHHHHHVGHPSSSSCSTSMTTTTTTPSSSSSSIKTLNFQRLQYQLYNREIPQTELKSAFARVCQSPSTSSTTSTTGTEGVVEIVLVHGHSGVGKTALLNDYKRIFDQAALQYRSNSNNNNKNNNNNNNNDKIDHHDSIGGDLERPATLSQPTTSMGSTSVVVSEGSIMDFNESLQLTDLSLSPHHHPQKTTTTSSSSPSPSGAQPATVMALSPRSRRKLINTAPLWTTPATTGNNATVLGGGGGGHHNHNSSTISVGSTMQLHAKAAASAYLIVAQYNQIAGGGGEIAEPYSALKVAFGQLLHQVYQRESFQRLAEIAAALIESFGSRQLQPICQILPGLDKILHAGKVYKKQQEQRQKKEQQQEEEGREGEGEGNDENDHHESLILESLQNSSMSGGGSSSKVDHSASTLEGSNNNNNNKNSNIITDHSNSSYSQTLKSSPTNKSPNHSTSSSLAGRINDHTKKMAHSNKNSPSNYTASSLEGGSSNSGIGIFRKKTKSHDDDDDYDDGNDNGNAGAHREKHKIGFRIHSASWRRRKKKHQQHKKPEVINEKDPEQKTTGNNSNSSKDSNNKNRDVQKRQHYPEIVSRMSRDEDLEDLFEESDEENANIEAKEEKEEVDKNNNDNSSSSKTSNVDKQKWKQDDERDQNSETGSTVNCALTQLALVMLRLLRVICTPERPVVLILEDLHWADEQSLDFVSSVMNEVECRNLLFIGSFRSSKQKQQFQASHNNKNRPPNMRLNRSGNDYRVQSGTWHNNSKGRMAYNPHQSRHDGDNSSSNFNLSVQSLSDRRLMRYTMRANSQRSGLGLTRFSSRNLAVANDSSTAVQQFQQQQQQEQEQQQQQQSPRPQQQRSASFRIRPSLLNSRDDPSSVTFFSSQRSLFKQGGGLSQRSIILSGGGNSPASHSKLFHRGRTGGAAVAGGGNGSSKSGFRLVRGRTDESLVIRGTATSGASRFSSIGEFEPSDLDIAEPLIEEHEEDNVMTPNPNRLRKDLSKSRLFSHNHGGSGQTPRVPVGSLSSPPPAPTDKNNDATTTATTSGAGGEAHDTLSGSPATARRKIRKELRKPRVTDIELKSLSVSSINDIVAAVTGMGVEETANLAVIVARKTHGNADSVIRFLEILQNDKLLQYSPITEKWEWDPDEINEQTKVTVNVGELLAGRIKTFATHDQTILMLAAFIGISFDQEILEELAMVEKIFADSLSSIESSPEKQGEGNANIHEGADGGATKAESLLKSSYQTRVIRVLEKAAKAGVIHHDPKWGTIWHFSHDLVHQSLYSMETRKPKLRHLRIGRIMKAGKKFHTSPKYLFSATNQLNYGSFHIESEEERIELISMNLEASQRARSALSFYAVLEFLEKAILIIDYSIDWQAHYELVLDVYSTAAEAAYSCGKLERSMELAKEVVENGRVVQDRLRAHFVIVELLGVQRRLSEALTEGYMVLELLGCHIPQRQRKMHLRLDLVKIKRLLMGRSTEDLLSMKPTEDPMKVHTLRLLDSLSLIAWMAAQDSLFLLLMTRMMLVTLKYGLSVYTPFSFASYGMLLSHLGDVNGAFRFGNLALHLVERLKSKISLTRTVLIVYSFTNHLRNPLLESVEPMLNAHRIGLEVGDVEYSSMCLSQYTALYIAVGLPLAPYAEDMKEFCEQLELHNQDQCVALMLPYWQFALNLMGKSEDKLVLTGEAMDQDYFLANEDVSDRDEGVSAVNLRFVLFMLAYIFQEVDLIEERWKEEQLKQGGITGTHFLNYLDILFSGLAAFALYRTSGKRKYNLQAKNSIKMMKDLVKRCGLNCHAMYLLLLAEEQSFRRADVEKARKAYDYAIACLARCGYIHLEAIALERAGDFMHAAGDTYWSNVYYERSVTRYAEWGAHAKAEILRDAHQVEEGGRDPEPSTRISVRGQRRFDPTTWMKLTSKSSDVAVGLL